MMREVIGIRVVSAGVSSPDVCALVLLDQLLLNFCFILVDFMALIESIRALAQFAPDCC